MHKYEYRYKFPQSEKSLAKKSSKIIRFIYSLFFLMFILLIFLVIYKGIRENVIGNVVISPVAKSISASVVTITKFIFPERLEDVVAKVLKDAPGDYAVSIKNLKTKESYELNAHETFQTASLYKLWVMATVTQQIENGNLDPARVLVKDIPSLNSAFGIASEDAELTDGTIELDIKRALNQMIIVSNNYAALSLMQEVGVGTVSAFLKHNGLNSSHTGNPPETTASDVMLYYEKLYKGELGSKESTQGMLNILKNQQVNDRIPKYLPENTVIGHKTGELDGFKHDAGIVYAPHGDYIIVLLSNTDNPQLAAETEAKVSKAVFDHFENE